MDAPVSAPSTPAYSRDSSVAAVAAAANPSVGSFGFAATVAPPSTGTARGLFMPPRITSAAGGLTPTPAVNPRAPILQLSNVARREEGQGFREKEEGGGRLRLLQAVEKETCMCLARRHWRHGRYEFCISQGRHGSTSGRHGRHVFRCANTFA
ncbi:hypothetical protein D1007_60327 [Hordeum vulgare]|nr:hypothetical protein D1007_60327 [Hordeum vulgare]